MFLRSLCSPSRKAPSLFKKTFTFNEGPFLTNLSQPSDGHLGFVRNYQPGSGWTFQRRNSDKKPFEKLLVSGSHSLLSSSLQSLTFFGAVWYQREVSSQKELTLFLSWHLKMFDTQRWKCANATDVSSLCNRWKPWTISAAAAVKKTRKYQICWLSSAFIYLLYRVVKNGCAYLAAASHRTAAADICIPQLRP